MGTIVYEFRNSIVDLENEMEQRETRDRRIRLGAVLVFLSVALMLNTDVFSALNVLNKSTLILGTALLALTVCRLTKEGCDVQKTRTLLFTGVAFLMTSLFAMAM